MRPRGASTRARRAAPLTAALLAGTFSSCGTPSPEIRSARPRPPSWMGTGAAAEPAGQPAPASAKPARTQPSPISPDPSPPAFQDPERELGAALASISAKGLMSHIRALSSDELEGRAPGSKGEELTVSYLIDTFRWLGLKPAGADGGFIQEVPLVGITSRSQASFSTGGATITLRFPQEYVGASLRAIDSIEVADSEVVFVGYGVQAPEFGWDDFKGADVAGKTLLFLVNDPPVPDPADPSRLDASAFGGRAMTYYGRWTYKFEKASELKASAALIIHETEPAGYPYEVVIGSFGRENFDLQRPGGNSSRVAFESWISSAAARRLLALAGKDFETLKAQAARRDFRPVPLGVSATLSVQNSVREVRSANVVARLDGADTALRDEAVVYVAHWDHLGRDPGLQGDQIYNGARDNASGTGALLELARAFSNLRTPPRRSAIFLAVTAEEKGLLGAKHYVEHPLVPLEKTLAVINMDAINVWGATRDIVAVGMGMTSLDDMLAEAAARQGRVVRPDPEPEKGTYYRSDHFEFAKMGVPALEYGSGTDFIGREPGYGTRKRDEYTQRDYHKVTDEIKADWDLRGAVEDLKLLFEVGWRVAQGNGFPGWKPGTEFKARREASLAPGR